jgi:predicted RNase H-like nuclease (RuvC/YqgF family)
MDMNEDFEALEEQASIKLSEWLQRVSEECGGHIGSITTEVIERTLKEQRERIAELEAERDSIARLGKAVEIENRELKKRVSELEAQATKEAQETIEMEAELNRRIKELEAERDRAIARHGDGIAIHVAVQKTLDERTRELADCLAMNAALVAASASGAGVTWEYALSSAETLYQAQSEMNSLAKHCYELHSLILQYNGHWAIVMQRPAQSEGDE